MVRGRMIGVKRVIAALIEARGLISKAATLLDCDWDTVRTYVNRYPEVKAALDQALEESLDHAEHKLHANIDGGDQRSIEFYLKTRGRKRGYGDRVELTGADGGPIDVDLVDQRAALESRLAQLAATLGAVPRDPLADADAGSD